MNLTDGAGCSVFGANNEDLQHVLGVLFTASSTCRVGPTGYSYHEPTGYSYHELMKDEHFRVCPEPVPSMELSELSSW